MKKIFLLLGYCSVLACCIAQQTAGKVVYERTMQMQIRIADNDEAEHIMPKSHSDKFELIFAGNQSLLKHVDEDVNEDAGGNGMQLRMIGPGQDDVVYYNFNTAYKVEQREMFDKTF
ncbi:MAG: hypothetical protein ABIN97_07420, partial [Ginsengibacter sp.]